jgi:hypothetical protein
MSITYTPNVRKAPVNRRSSNLENMVEFMGDLLRELRFIALLDQFVGNWLKKIKRSKRPF